jgi:hypothetical protein
MVFVAKYNTCHGAKGKFCSGGSGGGGGGGKGDVPNARLDLKPLVGKEVKVTYWAEKPGSGGRFRCIRDVKVEGTSIQVQHIWVQKPTTELMSAKYGQKQTAVGLVQKYQKRGGSDYTIQGFKDVVNKSFTEEIFKFNPYHDSSNGRFTTHDGLAAAYTNLAPGEIDPALYTEQDVQQMSAALSAVIRKEGITGFNGKIFLEDMNEPGRVLETQSRYDMSGKSSYYEVQLAIMPGLRIAVKESWKVDSKAVAAGKLPFNSCGYAKTEQDALTATMMHEVGHMILLDRTMKSNKSQWANQEDPTEGTKKWVDTVNAEAKAGWKPPSTYSQTNYGEMFAECYTTIALKQTTGSKAIDKAVGEVVLSGK